MEAFPEDSPDEEGTPFDIFVALLGLCRMVQECAEEVKCNRRKCNHLATAISEIPTLLENIQKETPIDEGDLRILYQFIQGACDLIQDFSLKSKDEINRVLFAKEARVSFIHIEHQLLHQISGLKAKYSALAAPPAPPARGRSDSLQAIGMMRVESIEADRTEVWSSLRQQAGYQDGFYPEHHLPAGAGVPQPPPPPPRSRGGSECAQYPEPNTPPPAINSPLTSTGGPDPKPWWVDYRHLVFAVDEGTGRRELLGVGRCGKVYLATYFGTKVAVKEPHNNDDLSPEAIEEFEREIDESYCMRHRNLVPILGGGAWHPDPAAPGGRRTRCFIIMEYLPDRSLAELLFQKGAPRLPPAEAAAIAFGICAAVVYLHGHRPRPVVHKAIRPENILLGPRHEPKLVDLALPRVAEMDAWRSHLNGHGPRTHAIGSAEWMAPEEFGAPLPAAPAAAPAAAAAGEGDGPAGAGAAGGPRRGEGEYDTRSDVYAVGLLLIALHSGRAPFDTTGYESVESLVASIQSGLLAPDIPSDMPPKLREFARRCTSLDPAKRPTIVEAIQFCEELAFAAHENPYYLNHLHRKPTLWEFEGSNLEAETLSALYQKTHGHCWERSEGWLRDGDLGCWYGVEMKGRSVDGLYLSENDLAGPLPRSICNLILLDTLDLSFNSLSGFVPEEIGSLENLRVLLLNDNKFSGPLPRSLAKLAKLERCVLSWNALTGIVPSALGALRRLRVLYLCGNRLTGLVPPALAGLNTLEALSLHSNKLQGNMAEIGLEKLTNLTSLDMSSNYFSGKIPDNLGQLTRLKKLHLNQNLLTGEVPTDIWQLSNLKQLYLNGNMLNQTLEAAAWMQEQLPACSIRI